MIQTDNAPTTEHILAWLAAQPCPCPEHKKYPHHSPCRDIKAGLGKVLCSGSGLAFEWASVKCGCLTAEERQGGDHCDECGWVRDANAPSGWSYIHSVERPCTPCNGSGRVPKAVGLTDIHVALRALGQGIRIEYRPLATGRIDCLVSDDLHVGYIATGVGDTDIEAALRAIAAQAGMP